MSRPRRGGGPLGAVLALTLLAAAAATAGSPAQVGAGAELRAGVASVLASAQGFDPTFELTFSFERAVVYELSDPWDGGFPLRATPWQEGVVQSRASDGRVVFVVANDVRGLSLPTVPENAAPSPAEFAARARELGDRISVAEFDPRELDLAAALSFDLVDASRLADGLLLEVRGDFFALFRPRDASLSGVAHGGAPTVTPADAVWMLVQAEDATLRASGQSLAALVSAPPAEAILWGSAGAQTPAGGVEANQESRVESNGQGVDLAAAARVQNDLLSEAAAEPVGGDDGIAVASEEAADALSPAFVGAALLAAGLAVSLASLWAYAPARGSLFLFVVPLYARLTSREILGNEVRERIFQFVAQNPGANTTEVAKAANVGWGATVYHLRVLSDTGFLACEREGRSQRWFVNGATRRDEVLGRAVLANGNAARIARIVLEKPGVEPSAVAAHANLARPTVAWHLERLRRAGLLTETDGEGGRRLYPGETLPRMAESGLC